MYKLILPGVVILFLIATAGLNSRLNEYEEENTTDVAFEISSFDMKSEEALWGKKHYLILNFTDGTSKVVKDISGIKVKKGKTSEFHAKEIAYENLNTTTVKSIVIILTNEDYKSFNTSFTSTFNREPIYD